MNELKCGAASIDATSGGTEAALTPGLLEELRERAFKNPVPHDGILMRRAAEEIERLSLCISKETCRADGEKLRADVTAEAARRLWEKRVNDLTSYAEGLKAALEQIARGDLLTTTRHFAQLAYGRCLVIAASALAESPQLVNTIQFSQVNDPTDFGAVLPACKAVPIEPTEAMLDAGREAMFTDLKRKYGMKIARAGWKAMVHAATTELPAVNSLEPK